MVWGGRRLGDLLGKVLPTDQLYGESWEVSDHASHHSIVADGPLAGQSLRDLMLHQRRPLLGAAASAHAVFPWLVKFLDAHDWLSVQVHPDDVQVQKWWPGEGGKTEVWFVLDTLPESRIYAGLLPGVDEETMRRALTTGTVAECLHSFAPARGDCIFLPAGTVHAVGGGVLLAEIQQTSDATFRLFDWNRVDAQGRSRTLHIEQGLACIHWQQGPVQPVRAENGCSQTLARSRYFHLETRGGKEPFAVGGTGKLQLLIPLHGQGALEGSQGRRQLRTGQVLVLPAALAAQQCVPETALTCLVCTLPE
jgi:mannose-6-phosphate isomerase